MKVTLFTDLDNTLIHSHRRKLAEPRTCVELLNGKQQSFSLDKLTDYLASQEWLDLIPLTMRSTMQYERLEPLARKLNFSRALVCNGAVLLREFENDDRWIGESKRLAAHSSTEFNTLLNDSSNYSVVLVDPFMFYIKTKNPSEIFNRLEKLSYPNKIIIYMDSRKVYCLPSYNNKGEAVRRVMKDSHGLCFAMGDSEPDIPMLNEADYALCPDALYSIISPRRKKYLCDFKSSDSVIQALDSIKKEVF